MRIKSDYVSERCSYLTSGKEYEVLREIGGLHKIITDTGRPIHILLSKCASLDGRAWDIVG